MIESKEPSPTEPISLPPGPWVLFARHPAELLPAAGGSTLLAAQRGVPLAIVYTHEKTVPGDPFAPEIRRIALGWNDAGAGDERIRAVAALVTEIAPSTVFLPDRLGADPELRALAAALEQSLQTGGYRGAAWYYPPNGIGQANRLIDISSVQAAKLAARAQLDPALADAEQAVRAGTESFWAVERFEPMGGAASALLALSARVEELNAGPRAVSVVVRTKDRPQLLAEALASLLLQTGVRLEVIVVNDGGRSVAAVVEPFRSPLQIVLIELESPQGRSAAANVGIRAATSDWLAILDDDDVYLPNGITALAAGAIDEGVVYYGNVEAYAYRDGSREHLRTFAEPFDLQLMLFENQIPFIGCLMPLHHVRALGGLDENLECFEDWDLYLKLAQRCRFVHVDRPVAEYRSHGESFITGKGGEAIQREGLRRIFERHLLPRPASDFAGLQLAVKQRLIPREVRREAERIEQESRARLSRLYEDLSAENRRRQAWFDDEIAVLRTRLESLGEKTLVRAADAFVSVIIVNYNGRHHLEKCLPSLYETRRVRFEVIVVDNGSSDDSVAWISENYPQVRVIAERDNLGFGRANLVGVHAARGGFVALLNSDTVVTPDWLFHLLAPLMLDPGIGTTCSQLRLLSQPQILNARGGGMSRLGFGFDIDFGCPYQPQDPALVDVLFPSGAAMLMRKQEFLDIGAFDPAFFMYHEDVDLGWRYWLLGKRVVLCPASEVFHAFGGTTKVQKGASFRDWMGNRHNLRSLFKNYELRNALGAGARLVKLWLRTGQFGLAWHALFWNLVHIRGTVRERRRLQRLRRIPDSELFARGLITPVPPPMPRIPPAHLAAESGSWLVSHTLLPGRTSAAGRLGAGWYGPEQLSGEVIRCTCGLAGATLKAAPGTQGILSIDLHLPDELRADTRIALRCNGAAGEYHLEPGNFWERIELPVLADAAGLLHVEIESTPWYPHQRFANGDFRRMGVAVRQVELRTGAPEPDYLPSRVSVLITTFNRWPVLEVTLGALLRQSWRDYELVIVDDGSTDGTWERLEAWREAHREGVAVKILRQENTGQGIARNNGLAHAEGELVLFMGDDIIPDDDFIEQHVRGHRDVGMACAVVGYTEWDRSGMEVTPLLAHANESGHQFGYRYMEDGSDVPYTCFYTSNVSIPRAVLGSEPFDPSFRTYGWEDVEVGYRLSKRGLRIVYRRAAHARHRHPMELRDFYTRQRKVGAAIGKLYQMHPELMADQPIMPPARPPRWLPVARHLVPPLLPLLNWLDRRQVALPARVYDLALGVGFWLGRES